MTEVGTGRLFQIAGTADLKARPPYTVLVRGAWSMTGRNVHKLLCVYEDNTRDMS